MGYCVNLDSKNFYFLKNWTFENLLLAAEYLRLS